MATADEIRIAHEIMKAVRRLQLPLKLDEITEGRGNCFPLSILAQCRRQEKFQHLSTPIRALIQQGDPTLQQVLITELGENTGKSWSETMNGWTTFSSNQQPGS